jgi:hypothetical protein
MLLPEGERIENCKLSNAMFWEYTYGAHNQSEILEINFKCVTWIVVKHVCGYGHQFC